MYPENMSIEVFNNAVRTIFINFMARRTDWTFAQASEEWNVLIAANLDFTSAMDAPVRRDLYLEKCRKGSSFRMNRKRRLSLLMCLENAINHATYSDMIYKNGDHVYQS